MKRLRRTMLFMPGNNPSMLINAAVLGADSIILDLEDAVSIAEKDSARILVREAIKNLDYSKAEVVVRINPLDSVFGMEDLKEISKVRPDALMVPKADEEEIRLVHEALNKIEKEEGFEESSIKLIPLIETAFGLESADKIINASNRVIAVLLGGEDLTSDLGIKRTKAGEELFYARNKIANVCRAFKVDSIDTPFTDTNDEEGLKADTLKAKSLGFTGKAAINPRQIDTIHSVFAPSEEEIRYALKILNAMEEAKAQGKGVFAVDGKMVDAPVINRALTTVSLAKTLGMI